MKNNENVIDMYNTEININTVSKRKLCDVEIPNDVFFVYLFNKNIKERKINTTDFYELDGKTCSLKDDTIIWTSPIEIDSITLSREILLQLVG